MNVEAFTLTAEGQQAAPYPSLRGGYMRERDFREALVYEDSNLEVLWVQWIDGRMPQLFPLSHVTAFSVSPKEWP